MFFYQLPWLPEALGRRQNWKMLIEALTKTSRPGTFTAEDLDHYRQAWSQPNAFQSMLNWYRAMMQKAPTAPPRGRIRVPTLMVWGAQDKFLGREMAQPSIDLCKDGRLVFLEEATHWVQHEEAERVNELIDSFFRDNG
jgi:pimeloyl-ACP methyl ester carboxylesterase